MFCITMFCESRNRGTILMNCEDGKGHVIWSKDVVDCCAPSKVECLGFPYVSLCFHVDIHVGPQGMERNCFPRTSYSSWTAHGRIGQEGLSSRSSVITSRGQQEGIFRKWMQHNVTMFGPPFWWTDTIVDYSRLFSLFVAEKKNSPCGWYFKSLGPTVTLSKITDGNEGQCRCTFLLF